MLANHINKFSIVDNTPKLNSNVDEIINNYDINTEKKNLVLNNNYGFPKNVKSSLETSYVINNSEMSKKIRTEI